MKITRKKIVHDTISWLNVGDVFEFTRGVYQIGESEPCIKIPYARLVEKKSSSDELVNPCACVSLISGKRIIVPSYFKIQKLDVELHILGDLP